MATPLNVISGRASLIGSGRLPDEQVADNAGIVRRQTERLTQMIRRVLSFARTGERRRSRTVVADLVRETIELLQQLAEKTQVELSSQDRSPGAGVFGDAGELRQVLSNLVLNAIQALPDGGTVQVAVEMHEEPGGGGPRVEVAVRDDGTGIEPDTREHIFEPFFTTKGPGIGTGLGLWASRQIVREHGGEIRVDSTPGEGSCFTVALPASVAAS